MGQPDVNKRIGGCLFMSVYVKTNSRAEALSNILEIVSLQYI